MAPARTLRYSRCHQRQGISEVVSSTSADCPGGSLQRIGFGSLVYNPALDSPIGVPMVEPAYWSRRPYTHPTHSPRRNEFAVSPSRVAKLAGLLQKVTIGMMCTPRFNFQHRGSLLILSSEGANPNLTMAAEERL